MYSIDLSMTDLGTTIPAFRQARSGWSWVTVTDPSSKFPPSEADTYPQPPLSVWALPVNSTALVRSFSRSLRRFSSSSSPYTLARNRRPNPWPYMYRLGSVGLFGLPNRPFGRPRFMNHSTARLMFWEYLPSRMVLPSMSIAMPASPVIVVGYWPPWASQQPSDLFWFLASHSRPRRMFSWTSTLASSARTAPGEANRHPAAVPRKARRLIGLMARVLPAGGKE